MSRFKIVFLFYILPLPVIIISLFVGVSSHADFLDYCTLLYKYCTDGLTEIESTHFKTANNIIIDIRLPRILLTFIIGSALGSGGTVLQAILKNPLVDSYILGISSASAFGASLSLAFGFLHVSVSAFLFAVLAVIITFGISTTKGVQSVVSVVLSGMIVSGVFTALLSVVQYIVNPLKLSAIVQWMLGNLHSASWTEFYRALPPIVISLVIIFIYRWRLNLLALGDDASKAVGINPLWDKIILIIAVTVMTASAVSSAGIISMYGLFIPHIVRMIAGADHKITVPGSIFFGGTFLLVIDNFSRSVFEFEIPVGIFTMILGGIFFIYLMKKNKLNWF